MDETAEHLHKQIERAHEGVKEDLQALETKAAEAVDWRVQFERRPLLLLGLAVGGGMLAAGLVGGGSSRRRVAGEVQPVSYSTPRPPSPGSERVRHIRDTLAAVAAGVATDMLHQAVPGFKEQFDKVKERFVNAAHSVSDQAANHTPMRASTDRRAPGSAYNAPEGS